MTVASAKFLTRPSSSANGVPLHPVNLLGLLAVQLCKHAHTRLSARYILLYENHQLGRLDQLSNALAQSILLSVITF